MATTLLLLCLVLLAQSCHGRMPPELARKRTTTNEQDDALSDAAFASATAAAVAAAAAANAADPAAAVAADAALNPTASASAAGTASPQDLPLTAADTPSAAPIAAAAVPTAAVAAVVAAACVSPQFEWPKGSGYCWRKRDSGGAQAGPGSNVFAASNVAINSADQLVLTILNPNNMISKSSCGEVFLNQTYGYGDYTFVVATNPAMIDQRLVGAPFIYDDDTKEFDFEFARWNSAGANNSQFVVQPYTTNPPVRFNINAVNTTHRMRWTPSAVVFESYYPQGVAGGGRIFTWTYTGPNNFVPGTERVHINYWISTRVRQVPASSTYITSCFRFCAAASLATCSTPLGTKPSCSGKVW